MSSTNSSSSTGMDSDSEEIQSSDNGPFDSMELLEEALPQRKLGLSSLYEGRSKSFRNLGDALTLSSAKELAKPEKAYIRKRRQRLASRLARENFKKRRAISKGVVTNSSRNTLPFAAAMNLCSTSEINSGKKLSTTSTFEVQQQQLLK